MNRDEFREWYGARRSVYEALARVARDTVTELLRQKKIIVAGEVVWRAKDLEKACEKVTRRGFSAPDKEMHDLAGVRVTTFIVPDIDRVAGVLREAFNVHADKSEDKAVLLGVDKVGYRGLHLICDLGDKRLALPELKQFHNMLFEVQVRTILQHAWAEVEHDRGYKFAGTLPQAIDRKFKLIAGLMEIADIELSNLAAEVDSYSAEVGKRARSGDLGIPMDTVSLTTFLRDNAKRWTWIKMDAVGSADMALAELMPFGVRTLADIDELLNPAFLSASKKATTGYNSPLGFLRDAMLYADAERYFKDAWNKSWTVCDTDGFNLIASKYGRKRTSALLGEHGIEVADEDVD